jgi:hypothetical protein
MKGWIMKILAIFLVIPFVLMSCSHKLSGPEPQVSQADPAMVCTEQLTTTVTITGDGLSPLTLDSITKDPNLALPQVSLILSQTLEGSPQSPGDQSVVIPEDRLTWTSQNSMTLDLYPELELEPGVYDIRVENRNGNFFVLQDGLVAVPPPVLNSITPDLICVAQTTNTLTLAGESFLQVGDELPEVKIGENGFSATSLSDCVDLAGPISDAKLCKTMTLELPQDALIPGSYQVHVVNPTSAGCTSEENVTLAVVPPPSIDLVEPDLICNAQSDDVLTITGEGFLDIDGSLPMVDIGGHSFQATSINGCADVTGTTTPTRECTTLSVSIPEGSLEEGANEVVVTNLAPAECSSAAFTLYVVAPPEITHSQPSPPCNADPESLEITGTGFLEINTDKPTVLVNNTPVTITDMVGCVDMTGPAEAVKTCTNIFVSLPAGLVSIGAYQVSVQNPAPAQCQDMFDAVIGLQPTLDSISPMRICETGGQITIIGSNFLEGGQVTIGDTPADYVNFISDTQLEAGVGEGLDGGSYDVTVTNPDGCFATLEQALQIVELPLVYYVDPPVIYSGISIQVTIFASGIAGVVTDVSLRPTGQAGPLTALEYVFDPGRSNRVQAIVPMDVFTPGGYDVILSDDVGCVAELIDGLTVTNTQTLALKEMQPPFGWTNEATGVVLYAQDSVTPPDVQFQATPRAYLNPTVPSADTLATALSSVAFIDSTKVNAVVPAGLSVGSYDLIVVNPDGTLGVLSQAFEVTAESPPIVDSISPGSVISQTGQVVDVQGDFFRNPEVTAYCRVIDPNNPTEICDISNNVAQCSSGCADLCPQLNDTKCNGSFISTCQTVASGCLDWVDGVDCNSTGEYCDDTSGSAQCSVSCVDLCANDQDTRCQGSLIETCQIVGSGCLDWVAGIDCANTAEFCDDTSGAALCSANCVDLCNLGDSQCQTTVVETCGIVASGCLEWLPGEDCSNNPQYSPDLVSVPATGVTSDGQNINATFDMSAVSAGAVCIVKVTNDDGTYFDYSAVSITNPSRNLSPFMSATSMLTPRRALASVAGRPTRTARYLFSIGGDSGSVDTAMASIEAAPVDPFGDLGDWQVLSFSLNSPRTFAGATNVGEFVYLVGGNDGATAVNTVYRAKVLKPSESPQITDVDIKLGEELTPGLSGGVWYYRVSATFADTHPENPNGESLASDPFVIQIPDMPEGVQVTLVWTAVDNASGYRIYRSPDPNLTSGAELLIDEVASSPLTYTDTGLAADLPGPLLFGSLGAWAEIPQMISAREGAGVVGAFDPSDSSSFYIYAIGGRDENGIALTSYEYLPITINPDGSHQVGVWTAGLDNLPLARWQLGAFLADHAHADIVPLGTSWIYAGPGVQSNGTSMENSVYAGQVQVGGDLGTWIEVSSMSPARAGYGYTLANSTLYAFGGQGADASDGGHSSEIVGPPDLDNWNSLGGARMTEARYLPGSVTESSFIFIVGGWNGSEVTSSVDKTIW